MAETIIRIESNPFQERVRYYRWSSGWQEITLATSPNSALHSEKLVKGFFPFKAEEIVETILSEFGEGGSIEIVFEGSEDEWQELAAICSDGPHADQLNARRGERSLANARDVLPEIIEVFKDIQPLVDDSISERKKVSEQIRKFTDVSSDVIPLCVLGNYSAGKSTFINALIGMEILPNGDEPVTARVFQIKRSKDRDRAMVKLSYGGSPLLLRFDKNGLMENKELDGEPLYAAIAAGTAASKPGMASHMNAALKVLNSYKSGEEKSSLNDLIGIEVPFSDSDPWPHDRDFVIFDTPGSNSATHEDHARVLRKAMDGLSNGLPIFVAEYSSLDSTDNEKLYREIEQIPAIDTRFAMIVVNKADSADLPRGEFSEDDVARIMRQSIPSSLYGQGIFFVSAILGLGSKTSGEFESDNYAEKFEDQERKYVDPTSRFYKTLYRYDILPGQISRRTNRESEACKDLLLANSGLFCVENEIRLFAERYSAYNKCSRSETLLQEIIRITEEEIATAKASLEAEKTKREAELDRDKTELIGRLGLSERQARDTSAGNYDPAMDEKASPEEWTTSVEVLLARQYDITEDKKSKLGYREQSINASNAFGAILPNLRSRLSDSVKSEQNDDPADRAGRLIDGIADAALGLRDDTYNALQRQSDVAETGKAADRDAANQLFDEVVARYEDSVTEMAEKVDALSQAYWKEQAEKSRGELYRIATGSDSPLSKEKRQEVGEIIINYQALSLAGARREFFNKADFTELRWKDLVIFKSDKLFLGKLERKFNQEIEESFSEIRSEIRGSHVFAFNSWLAELLHQITDNITNYNPLLHGYVEQINEQAMRIDGLEAQLSTLRQRKEHIARVIGWKE